MVKEFHSYAVCNDAPIMKKIKDCPKIEDFFNDLSNISCSLEDYNFGFDVYKEFKCKNLYEYTIL